MYATPGMSHRDVHDTRKSHYNGHYTRHITSQCTRHQACHTTMRTTFPIKPSVRSFCLLLKWGSNKDNKHHPVVSELVSQWFWLPTRAWVAIAVDTYGSRTVNAVLRNQRTCAFSGNNSCRIWHLTTPAPTLSSEQTLIGEDTALPLLLAKARRSVGAQFELCLDCDGG